MRIALYIITFINCFINAFARYSKGEIFENKRLWKILHFLTLAVVLVISIVRFGWLEIIWILLIDIIGYFPSAFIIRKLMK